MKIKTKDLIGSALDWSVARCEGEVSDDVDDFCMSVEGEYDYSTDWAQGGPIIDREVIALTHPCFDAWTATGVDNEDIDAAACKVEGPTALIAAMRCYVASKMGDEVDVPDELTTEQP